MAKVELNSALSALRGKMDNWVYRRTRNGITVGRRPRVVSKPTAAQRAIRERFRQASAFAKSALLDPALRARYEHAARARNMRTFAFVVSDFLNPPVVDLIDTTEFHGRAGDLIRVNAFDDFEVAAVAVTLRNLAGETLMSGRAVLVDGRWHYATTDAIAAGETVQIEAIAQDRPGRTSARIVSVVVG